MEGGKIKFSRIFYDYQLCPIDNDRYLPLMKSSKKTNRQNNYTDQVAQTYRFFENKRYFSQLKIKSE